jgi:Transposase family tnp2
LNLRLTVDDDKVPFLNAEVSAARLKTLTGIKHVRIACCRNSCIAYTGVYADLANCPLCNEPRYDKKNIIIRTFDLIPITHRLRLQFANTARAKALRDYPKFLQENTWDGVRDYWDGELHKEHKNKGYFADHRDIALGLSTDGLQLFAVGTDSVWPILFVNLNLKPEERFKKHNLLLCGIIPGPNNPKDIHSFLRPVVEELKALASGIENVYDAHTKEIFTMRAHLVLVNADLPAMAKTMGISGHGSYNHCRFCEIQGIHSSSHIYCPLRTPKSWPEDMAFDHNPAWLPLRDNATYRRVAVETLRHEAFNPQARGRCEYGVAQYSMFYQLDTIDFPRSFPNDVMHLIFQNVVPNLFRWWSGEFLPKNEDDPDYVDELAIPKPIWRDIGSDMERSLRSIPSSYGKSLRNIQKYNKSFKAEEWSNFLLHYSSVLLHDRLRQDLFEHYGKLVAAIDLAIDYEISNENIRCIKSLLIDFVSEYEELYYQYEVLRVLACLPTFHLLLHLHESISDCGPAWVFWQFPCERMCGMLKPMVKNRSNANRNLSLGILYQEQLNHLPFATPSWTMWPWQRNIASPNFTKDLDGRTYSFLHPRSYAYLLPEETVQLVRYYANLLNCTPREINLNEDVNRNITKWARCLLAGDVDAVSSSSYEGRRDAVNGRASSVVRLSQLNDDGQPITQYAKVIHFFVHKFRESEEMLAYVQIYRFADHSSEWGCAQENKIIRLIREGPMEVMSVTALDEGIGIMKREEKEYLIVRRRILFDDEEEDTSQ